MVNENPYKGQFDNWSEDKLRKRLEKIEKELAPIRDASPMSDGWQTMRYAKKSRKADYLAMEKTAIRNRLEDIEDAKPKFIS